MRKITQNPHPAELKRRFSAKAVFGALLLLLLAARFTTTIQAQNAADDATASASSLKLWGTPGDVRLVAGEPNIKVRISLNVIAENTGKENLLLLRRTPASNSEEIVRLANPAVSIWHQEHEAGAQLHTDAALPKLRRALDQQEPPEDELITLGSGIRLAGTLWCSWIFRKAAARPNGTASAKPAHAL